MVQLVKIHKDTIFLWINIYPPILIFVNIFQNKTQKEPNASVQLLFLWLPCPDSNQEMRHQKPLCYHYTTRQSYVIWTVTRHKCGAKLLLFFELQPFCGFFCDFLFPHAFQ